MPRITRGTIYRTANGYGIRWPEGTSRKRQTGFRTKTDARHWFDEHIAPRLREHRPSADITLDQFCELYLERWGADVAPRTRASMIERLAPAKTKFGKQTLGELAADDIARWRANLPSEHARYRHTRALRQVLAAAVRWHYLQRNPAQEAGANAQPRADEIRPLTRTQVQQIADEIAVTERPLVIFAAETGIRTSEWVKLERRDIDRKAQELIIRREVAKTKKARRVPLTPAAVDALEQLPPRLATPLLFVAPEGGPIDLDNWRLREWYPALESAGVAKCGPYVLRHTFAAEAIAAGVSVYRLAEVMGTSVEMIDRHYGHLVPGSLDEIRALLARGQGV
jgi:integrase